MDRESRDQENINISAPKNLFILLVVGVLLIAAVLVWRFVILPVGETAKTKSAQSQEESKEVREKQEALSNFKRVEREVGLLAEMYVIIEKPRLLRDDESPNFQEQPFLNERLAHAKNVGIPWAIIRTKVRKNELYGGADNPEAFYDDTLMVLPQNTEVKKWIQVDQ